MIWQAPRRTTLRSTAPVDGAAAAGGQRDSPGDPGARSLTLDLFEKGVRGSSRSRPRAELREEGNAVAGVTSWATPADDSR